MYYLLYLAMGQERFCDEVICSVQSFFHVASEEVVKNTNILIHTDHKAYFEDQLGDMSTAVHYKSVKMADYAEYDIYLMKIKIIREFKTGHTEPFLLLDSDTYFLSCPGILFRNIQENNVVVMCTMENTIAEKTEHILQNKFSETSQKENNHVVFYSDIRAGKTFQCKMNRYVFDKNVALWNSGVIGVGPKVPVELFAEAEELASMLYSTYRYRVSEQFVLSYLLGRTYEIQTADTVILHYWFLKNAMPILWSYFFADQKHEIPYSVKDLSYEQLHLVLLAQFHCKTSPSIFKDILLDHSKDSLVYKTLNNTRLMQETISWLQEKKHAIANGKPDY